MLLLEETLLIFRQVEGVSQCAQSARDDRDFGDTGGTFGKFRHQGMTALVVGDDLLLCFVDLSVLLLQSDKGAFDRFEQVFLIDLLLVLPSGKQSSFIDNVSKVCPGKTGSLLGNHFQIDIGREFDPFGVNLQDRQTTLVVRLVHQYLTVETSRTQQGGIECLGAVGRSQDDHRGIGTETVHFGKELVECLLTLIIAAHLSACGSAFTDGVDLVDEDDGGCLFLCLCEEVTYTAGTDPYEHLDEAGTADREERYARFTCNGFGKECLTRTRRAHK